jgi:AAA family ATP:ADP antiporter
MFQTRDVSSAPATASRLDRALSMFTDVRPGEATTALLLLANIFVLLVCYAILKTVREPLILLGGGAEVRSYAAAGQALLLIGFVPLYSWFANKVGRGTLLVGVGLFFIAGLELFAAAVAAGLPYVGVVFFIWLGIFNISLVAQFWSFANDIYNKDAGARLFPIIMVGMTAGAPLGSFIAARLFRSGIGPASMLHLGAALLVVSTCIYLHLHRHAERRRPAPAPMQTTSGGFRLVLGNRYLRLIAALVVLLNVVNTTGEYLVARLLSHHVSELAQMDPGFDKQAYIGAFSGEYQFWVNVVALLMQAFLTSRLVKYAGLRGVLLALPLIALGGYAIIAAGAGFSLVRWIKTAENATDYSVMNTGRQLLWLPTSRDEKYKAKQAIDTFFVRTGDVISAGVVFMGANLLHLTVSQFAALNVAFTVMWLMVGLRILGVGGQLPRLQLRPLATAAAMLALVAVLATPAVAQETAAPAQPQTRAGSLAGQQAEKALRLQDYVPSRLEKRLETVESLLSSKPSLYPFIGSTGMEGGGFALGPGYRVRFGETGRLDTHAAMSFRRYKVADATFVLPSMANGRLTLKGQGNWFDAPDVAFYGTGNDSDDVRMGFSYRTITVGGTAQFNISKPFAVGAGMDMMDVQARPANAASVLATSADPTYRRSRVYAEYDTRTSPGYTRSGGLYRLDVADYRDTHDSALSFRRVDADVRQFVPVFRDNWVIALRALASSTSTSTGQEVPYFLMPELGGSHTLRGYSSWRFRDRNRLLLSGEYRWTTGRFVDMALFLDAGKVAPEFSDLGLSDMKKTYGVGLSLHTFTSTVTRIELARTPDGNSIGLSFSPSF